MKIKITAHIYYNKDVWDEKGKFEVFTFKFDDCDYRTYVGLQEIEIEVPDGYDPRAQQVAALEAKKKKVMAEYQKTVTEITERINKLQAIAA